MERGWFKRVLADATVFEVDFEADWVTYRRLLITNTLDHLKGNNLHAFKTPGPVSMKSMYWEAE